MAVHYSFLLLLLWILAVEGLDPNDKKYWDSEPGVVVFTALLYLGGQAVAWTAFWWNRHSTQDVQTVRH